MKEKYDLKWVFENDLGVVFAGSAVADLAGAIEDVMINWDCVREDICKAYMVDGGHINLLDVNRPGDTKQLEFGNEMYKRVV